MVSPLPVQLLGLLPLAGLTPGLLPLLLQGLRLPLQVD
jgi:hypothetical protein